MYDNACNTHRVCLKRSPRFFSKTSFRIDRLHVFNHTGCGSGYRLDDNLDPKFELAPGVNVGNFNSQVAEQTNRLLDRIRTQVRSCAY